jgi:serine/threonine protein kinase
MIGQTISHYKILEKLGEGGMGVVYKAQDLTLDRFVALKFLPAHLTVNDAEQARFLQEAKAAATINHPHVCTIHAVEEQDGQKFIVMEYVDGVTLRKKFEDAPLKANDALGYATQILEALQEAHSKGIVHRDIKSDNIMVNSKNQIKVMDFGLAKLKGSLKLTRTSSTVGTLAYMSPEQIQGGEVDARSDIFSFGVVLFEMLTRRTPFRGEHEAAMVYSIANEEPESLLKLRSDASPELERIIKRALEKDPEDRYQSAADMLSELRRVLKQSSRVSRAAISSAYVPTGVAPSPPAPTPVRSKKMLWMGIGGLGIAVLLVAIFLFSRKSSQEPNSVATLNPNMSLRVLPIPFTQVLYPSLSPDGNWVAFPAGDVSGKWDVYYMHVSGADPRRITADSSVLSGDRTANISPDGSQVVYDRPNPVTNGFDVCVVSSLGGVSKLVVEDGRAPRWRPDGQRIGYVRIRRAPSTVVYGFWTVNPDGSDNRLEFADSLGARGRFNFAWSADGRSIAWIRSFKEGYQEVITRALASGTERQLTFDKKNIDDVCWTRRGVIIFSSNKGGNTNLWMVPTEGGTPQQITKGSGPDIGISISSDDQKLLYLQEQRVGYIWSASIDGSDARQVTFDDRAVDVVSLSPDGKRIAFSMGDIDPLKPVSHLFVQDRDGANRRQITSGDIVAAAPGWSPDGRWISFSSRPASDPPDSFKIFVVDAAHPGMPRQLGLGIPISWVSSSTLLTSRPNATHNEIVSVDGGSQKQFYEDSTFARPVASGKLIAFSDLHKGKEGLWLISSDYAKNPSKINPKRLFAQDEVVVARFSSEYVYYWNQQGELWRMNFLTEKKERVKGTFPGLTRNSPRDVRSDDKEMIYVVQKRSGKLVVIENLFH